MQRRMHDKYGKNIVVIAGATTGLGYAYAFYFISLGYEKIVLIDSDYTKL